MNELIEWVSIRDDLPEEEVGVLLYWRGQVFWGDWNGKDFTDVATGLPVDVSHWASVNGPL